jgi:hypothetical protein
MPKKAISKNIGIETSINGATYDYLACHVEMTIDNFVAALDDKGYMRGYDPAKGDTPFVWPNEVQELISQAAWSAVNKALTILGINGGKKADER